MIFEDVFLKAIQFSESSPLDSKNNFKTLKFSLKLNQVLEMQKSFKSKCN